MIHGYLFKEPGLNSSSRPEHIYLKADFDFLCEGSLREDCLHLRNNRRVDNASLGADGVYLLSDPRDDGKVLWEVRRQDSRDPVRVQVL